MSTQHTRAASHTRIWRWVLAHGAASRTEVATAVRLSKVAVAGITAELITDGWLAETGTVGGYAGRPAGLVDLHPRAGTAMGIDLQRRVVRGWATDLRSQQGAPTEQLLASPQDATAAVLEMIRVAHAGAAHGPLRQVTLAVPAPVGARGQPEEPSGLPEFDAAEVSRWCLARGLPLAFENDVKLAAVAEHRTGVAVGADNFALLAERDTGVALGLFLGGRLYRGDQGRAGELSSLRWPEAGRLTPLEALAPPARSAALAQIVSGLAAALDLRLLIVQQGTSLDASPTPLVEQLRALAPGTVAVVPGHHGAAGPLQGAVQEAARGAVDELIRSGLPPLAAPVHQPPEPVPI